MDRKSTIEEIRRLLREAVKHSPKESRKEAEERFMAIIRQHCSVHVQTIVIELAKDLGMNELGTMVDVIPEIASDLLRGVALNVLVNTPEDKIEESGEMIDEMIKQLIDRLKISDYREAWKAVQKGTLEMTLAGKVGILEI